MQKKWATQARSDVQIKSFDEHMRVSDAMCQWQCVPTPFNSNSFHNTCTSMCVDVLRPHHLRFVFIKKCEMRRVAVPCESVKTCGTVTTSCRTRQLGLGALKASSSVLVCGPWIARRYSIHTCTAPGTPLQHPTTEPTTQSCARRAPVLAQHVHLMRNHVRDGKRKAMYRCRTNTKIHTPLNQHIHVRIHTRTSVWDALSTKSTIPAEPVNTTPDHRCEM